MTGAAPAEFSRLVPLVRLGPEPFRQDIVATETERAALAERFDLVSLDRLHAVVELTRQGRELVLLHAAFEADFVQRCVVTLDPVAGAVAERFTLLYGPPETEAEAGSGIGSEVAFEPLAGEAIDIGEAVAEEFSLALPPFPRRPDASIENELPPEAGPLGELSRLVERRSG
ncbi:MAG TPA: DUF177 domain-containing protein [Stellaceae bacterium]|nr:DUF177 domain-containing protein [Stellaceae bacterium]